jgi:dethiobiotin synthase
VGGRGPDVLVVVAGTGTEVGKTWFASGLCRELRRRGLAVAARKPAQSYEAPPAPGSTDAEILAGATGEKATEVCPPWRWYGKAMAPPMAAASTGKPPFGLRELAGELRWPAGARVGVVEQAGSIGSPQADDGDGVDMVELLRPRLVVLVARPGLGTLGEISLAMRALRKQRMVVYLNRLDPGDELHTANRAWISGRLGLWVAASVGDFAGDVERLLEGSG